MIPAALAALAIFVFVAPAAAEEYRCQVTPGLVRYQNTPCEPKPDRAAAADARIARAAEDERKRRQAADAKDRDEERVNPWGVAERLCGGTIREEMKHLEPTGPYSQLSRSKDDLTLRVAVRLADSFRAAPVGVIECRANIRNRSAHLEKVRM